MCKQCDQYDDGNGNAEEIKQDGTHDIKPSIKKFARKTRLRQSMATPCLETAKTKSAG
jgi:hypothetical protein